MTATIVTTPTVRGTLRRWLFWISLVVVVLLAVLITMLAFRTLAPSDALGASNPQPSGAQAIARVLAAHGVEVIETSSLTATQRELARDPGNTTVFVYDVNAILTPDQWATLSSARSVVLADPDYDGLSTLAPALALGGVVSGTLSADCALPAASAAGTIVADGSGYRVIDASADATACFDSGDGIASVAHVRTDGRSVTAVGALGVFDNAHVGLEGDAALAVGLLGGTDRLVWYLPGLEDSADGGTATLADATPPWVTPVIALGLIAGVVAAVWRGRRFGALVVEQLPVLVRASETMEGRARLYALANARLRAIDALRISTVSRLATACGLPRLATVDDVVTAVSALTGKSVRDIRSVLIDDVPQSDRDLVRMSDALTRLEQRVVAATRLGE